MLITIGRRSRSLVAWIVGVALVIAASLVLRPAGGREEAAELCVGVLAGSQAPEACLPLP